ncbi:hypothetical protein OC835_004440 [Tilletia horrida]|nr:hypothetical protein OC835_004440 [Tilletia horrida]
MDELQAMLSSGFGKRRGPPPKTPRGAGGSSAPRIGPQPAAEATKQGKDDGDDDDDDDDDEDAGKGKRPASARAAPAASLAATSKAQAPATAQDDDGLTEEDRRRNAELDRLAAEGGDSEDDGDDDDYDEDEEDLRPPTSNASGKRKAETRDGEDADEDEDDIGPPPPPAAGDGAAAAADDDSLPISHEAHLRDHTKSVTALAIDGPGARVATGASDYDVKLWDFGGMSSTFRPFKTFEPAGPYLLNDLVFSPSGQSLLVISATAQAKIYDREGAQQLALTKKGDVYLRDMRHTAGHVAEITCGGWHPNQANTFMTASADSSVRLWDAEKVQKHKDIIVVKSKTERGTRTRISAVTFSHDGRTLATACADGAVHLWATNSTFARPNSSIEGAHTRGTATSSVAFSRDNRHFATRGGMGDDTVKLWDARALKKPLAVHADLPSASAQTNVIFSSDEHHLLTGTAGSAPIEDDDGSFRTGRRDGKGGEIVVLSRNDLTTVRTFAPSGNTPTTSIIKLAWHPKINQLFASTSQGSVSIFYSPTRSVRGALLCVDRHVRSKVVVPSSEFTSASQMTIIVPAAEAANRRRRRGPDGSVDAGNLTMANVADGQRESEAAKRRRLDKLRQQPGGAAHMPERPLVGPGRGGRIGAAATQHVVQSIWNDNSRSEDPREALLKYADKAEQDPKWTAAWKATQPKPIFRADDVDEGTKGKGAGSGGGGGSGSGGGSGTGS